MQLPLCKLTQVFPFSSFILEARGRAGRPITRGLAIQSPLKLSPSGAVPYTLPTLPANECLVAEEAIGADWHALSACCGEGVATEEVYQHHQ